MFEKGGQVTIATIKPTALIEMYDAGPSLQPVAEEVERAILRIIDAAAA